jgi:hypothetical protein
MKTNTSISRQVASAKKQLEAWPDWMRKSSRFEGSDASSNDRHDQAQATRDKKTTVETSTNKK